jgi:cytochrome P450
MEISGRANVLAALSSPDLAVTPPAPPDAAPLTLAWLRAGVARFSRGPEHGPRRLLLQALLDRVDPAALRAAARDLTGQLLAGSPGQPSAGTGWVDLEHGVARRVPARVLADLLGWPTVSVEDVAAVARVYLTGPSGDEAVDAAADAAVARLVTAVGGEPDDEGAARVGVLVQSYEATAVLILNAADRAGQADDIQAADIRADDMVATTLAENPPTAQARRMATVDAQIGNVHIGSGETVFVNIGEAGLPFGAGPHACPGADHARAIAAGVLDALHPIS